MYMTLLNAAPLLKFTWVFIFLVYLIIGKSIFWVFLNIVVPLSNVVFVCLFLFIADEYHTCVIT